MYIYMFYPSNISVLSVCLPVCPLVMSVYPLSLYHNKQMDHSEILRVYVSLSKRMYL
jgi:hypothetical protein